MPVNRISDSVNSIMVPVYVDVMVSLYLSAARIYAYPLLCILMSFKSRNRMQIKTTCKMSIFGLDQNGMFFPMVHFSYQPVFSAYSTQLTGKESAPFERTSNFGVETTLRFYIDIIFVNGFYIRTHLYAYMRPAHTSKA